MSWPDTAVTVLVKLLPTITEVCCRVLGQIFPQKANRPFGYGIVILGCICGRS
ncbi:hypothetical protein [Synechococcus sp. M16CYN]|uniref:hypothetical protein n=1 Tax=Synechococcus sp. M16CYN TaxID=3103139 RepID=UPI00333F25C7